jgi:CBS-domain-containing membrane protein
MTLQYGLTAAPASQPRNAILGMFVGLFVAHGVGQAVNLDPWLKQTLATSLAISCMVKLGVTHPPAGAAALLFSNGQKTWQQIGVMFLGNVIAIICATFVNNLCERRQYPTFWGFEPVLEMMREDEDEAKEKKKK